jgi:2-methylaconitate cis-trans-isomerase PrpF
MHSTTRFHSVVAFALFTALSLTACGPGTLTKASVETGAMAALTAQVGQQAPQITCPGDMAAVVGTSQVCSMPRPSGTFDVTVTVTSIDGNTAKFSVVVASTPRP